MPRLSKRSLTLTMMSLMAIACVNIPAQEPKKTQPSQTDMSPSRDMAKDQQQAEDLNEAQDQGGRSLLEVFVGAYDLNDLLLIDEAQVVGALTVQTVPEGLARINGALIIFDRVELDGFELTLRDQRGVVLKLDTVIVDGWRELVTGRDHTCGMSLRERVYCWGRNNFGQLGVSLGRNQNIPTRIQNLQASTKLISGSDHLVALTNLGQVWGWGSNDANQLEVRAEADPLVLTPRPLKIELGLPLAAGERMTCYLPGEEAKCYGLGATTPWALPTNTWMGLSASGDRLCAQHVLTQEPSCYTITDPTMLTLDPLNLLGVDLTAGIVASKRFTCAWSDERVFCQAQDLASNDARVGTSADIVDLMPRAVFGGAQQEEAAVSVALGDTHGCLISDESKLYCWGLNDKQQLGVEGYGPMSASAIHLMRLGSGWVNLSSKHDHTCAVHEDGHATCWGDNSYGQLGHGVSTPTGAPARVEPPMAP